MRRPDWMAGVLAAAALCAPLPAFAHPHVFVEPAFELRVGGRGLDAIHVTWTFDEFYTEAILPDYDHDRNNRLSAKEVAEIETDIFRQLAPLNYYTALVVDAVPVAVSAVKGFNATVAGKSLVFEFTVPLAAPVKAKRIEFVTFDPEYYIEFRPNRKVAAGSAASPACQIDRLTRESVGFGPVDVEGLSCTLTGPGS